MNRKERRAALSQARRDPESHVKNDYIKHVVARWGDLMTELREEAEAAAGDEEAEEEMRCIRAAACLAAASNYFDKYVPRSQQDLYHAAAMQWSEMFRVHDGGVERRQRRVTEAGFWQDAEGQWHNPEGKAVASDTLPVRCPGCGREEKAAPHPWTGFHRGRCAAGPALGMMGEGAEGVEG